METDGREKIRNRLNRIAGQIAGLQKMLDDDRYCVDILTQVAAIRSALDSLGVALLSDHMAHCVANTHASDRAHPHAKKKSQDELIEEMRLTLSRFLR
jgi:DNA-binding FrmR family transcriptional regulator